MTGSASIVRNGVAIAVNTSDTLYQSDVVQTGSSSTLGLVLEDGTAFNLSANARFMLNELNYDPTSSSNSSLLTLVQGAATFVAGQVAPTGDMKVATPVAVIGIRGTAVLLDINSVDGRVAISVADQRGDGSHSIVAQDPTANSISSAPVVFTLQTTPPSVSITSPGGQAAQLTQTISGTVVGSAGEAAVGSTVTLYDTLNGVTRQVGTAPVGSNGAWTGTVTLSGNGANSIVAEDTDAAGNTGASAPVTFALATTSPTIAITTPIAVDNIINKSEAAAGVSISGTATPGSAAVNGQTATITIVDSTNVVRDTYTATVTNGTWSVAVTAAQAQALADGSYTVKANVSDVAGNAAPTASQAIAIETVAPTVTISTTGSTTNQATQSISGTVTAATGEAAVGPTVTLFDTLNGVTTQIGTAPVINGSWTGSVLLSGNGANSIVAQDTDAAGNTGASAPVTYTLSIIHGGWSAANGGSWISPANWSSGSVPTSTANVTFNSIGAPLPYSVVIPVGTTITVNSIALNDPETTIVDQGALAIASSLITTAGVLEVDNGGSLSVGASSSFEVEFAGTGGNLALVHPPPPRER
jgi:hypothetical protein